MFGKYIGGFLNLGIPFLGVLYEGLCFFEVFIGVPLLRETTMYNRITRLIWVLSEKLS